jgi:alginate O-acetyltransferase complex protein AlgI
LLFNSIPYWLFLPLVWLSYFALPFKYRWYWMLLASYVFYSFWQIEFTGLMALTTVIDYTCGLQIHRQEKRSVKLFWLWFSIGTNIAMLFMFKYFDFLLGDTALARKMYDSNLTAWIIELGKYVLPAGISFYTFQSISYVIDVYRGEQVPEKNLLRFMSFVSFFPQLVAGPIERFHHLYNQLHTKYQPLWEDMKNAFRLLLYGLFLKVCIADNLAEVVDTYYNSHAQYSAASTWLATFFFAFQVYADFFGYSLLAQGSALLFGIKLMDNFNKPYVSKSIPEFWHRWHISLSTWFRDYLFIPLGGNKRGPWVLALSVMVVFFTSGLWHGANMTMILFGVSQGVLYLFDRFIFSRIKSENVIWNRFRQVKTFFLFMITLVYFRSGSIPQSADVFDSLLGNTKGLLELQVPLHIFVLLAVFIALDLFIVNARIDVWLQKFSLPARWTAYAAMVVCVWLLGGAVNHPFVYFQF